MNAVFTLAEAVLLVLMAAICPEGKRRFKRSAEFLARSLIHHGVQWTRSGLKARNLRLSFWI